MQPARSKCADATQLGRNIARMTFAAALIASLAAGDLRAEPVLNDDEESPSSLSDLAREAGSRAAILDQCGIGSRPVMLAFERRLEVAWVSAAAKTELGESFQSARASAAAALVRSAANECPGAFGLLRETIRDLEQPALQIESAPAPL
jgi:hypothetical protein